MLLNNKRIETIELEPPSSYEAYLYLWSVWIEELNDWKYYGGWVAKQYHLTDYTDTTKLEEFRKDFATRKIIKFEILQYGRKNDMAYAERKMLAEADNGLGAKKSPKWYNKSNGGGQYANGYITNDPLDILWTALENDSFSKDLYKKPRLVWIIENGYLIQSRNELFDTNHSKILTDGFNSEPNPDEWDDIHILMDAKPILNDEGKMVGVEYCEGSAMIVGGNHRARGCVKSKNGWGLNGIEIPYEFWKDLTFHQLRTLSDRLNPFDPKPSKSIDPDSKAQWIIDECKEKKLYKKNANLEKVIDYKHIAIVNELRLICCPKSVQNKIFTTVQKLLDNEKLQLKQDNLIDLSEEGLKEDANLKKWYDKKVLNLLEEYDWVYKITADNYSILKVMEEIKRSGYAKKGIVLPYFKTLDHKESEAVKKSEKNSREFIKEFFKPAGFSITIKDLPVTLAEAKAEGYMQNENSNYRK